MSPPPDQTIFERLDAFGEAVWCIEGNSARQHVRDIWIDYLKRLTLIEHPWRTVEAAIRAGEKAVSVTTLGLGADGKHFAPRSVADLLADPTLEQTANWLVPGYVARGNVTHV